MYYLLFILPFLIIFNYKDKIDGFVKVLSIYTTYILSVTIFLQFYKIFNYRNLLISISIFAIASISYFLTKKKFFKFNYQYTTIVFFLISLFFLFIPNFVDYKELYLYPFYSDEWVNYGLSRYSVLNNNLPIFNYLDNGSYFINLLMPFNSFVSFFLLYFNSSVYTYVILGKICNFFILLSMFILLRRSNLNREVSLISVIVLLFITNSSSVTGLWNFIPLNLSFLFLVLSFVNNFNLNSILSALFYPPMSIVLIFNYFIKYRYKMYKYVFTIFILFMMIFLFKINDYLHSYIYKIFDLLIRPSSYLYEEKVNIFDMLPLISLPFILHGFYVNFYRKSNLNLRPVFYMIIFTSIFWIYYSFNSTIIIMDKVRFVTITSWLMIIPFSLSLDNIYKSLLSKFELNINPLYLHMIMIVFLVLSAKTYVYMNNKSNIGFINFDNLLIKTRDPVYKYINQEDLRIFNQWVKPGSIFLSSPWKGLVIATLTDNIPLNSKSSYLSINKYSYDGFIDLNCINKDMVSTDLKLRYFYGPKFNCPRFRLIDSNYNNNMFLYEFK